MPSTSEKKPAGKLDESARPCCVRGYHIYRVMFIWEAAVGELLDR